MNYKVIPFEYIGLDRAAEILNCNHSDFIHWWKERKIELFIELDCVEDSVLLSKADAGNNEMKAVEFKEPKMASEALYSDEYNLSNQCNEFYVNNIHKNKVSGVTRLSGIASGLWQASREITKIIINDKKIPHAFHVESYKNDMELLIGSALPLNKGDLRILKKDMVAVQDILIGKGDDIGSIDSTMLLRLLSLVLEVTTSSASSKRPKITQEYIASSIDELNIAGLKQNSVNKIFAMANKSMKSTE